MSINCDAFKSKEMLFRSVKIMNKVILRPDSVDLASSQLPKVSLPFDHIVLEVAIEPLSV